MREYVYLKIPKPRNCKGCNLSRIFPVDGSWQKIKVQCIWKNEDGCPLLTLEQLDVVQELRRENRFLKGILKDGQWNGLKKEK